MGLTHRFFGRRRPAAAASRITRWLGNAPPTPTLPGREGCLAHQHIECLICSTVCQRGALRFVPQPDGKSQPVLATELCDGCGRCVTQCPVSALELPPPD